MHVRLNPRVVRIYPVYSGKPKEVPAKNNMALLSSLSIQFPCGTKLMPYGTD